MANKKKAKKKPLAKGNATSSPLTKAQVKGFEETDKANKTLKVTICIFVMVATFCIYSQVQDHEFINYDDYQYIKDNWNIKSGFSSESISWAFTTFYAYNWFPITWLSHIFDYQLYGLNPKGHHLTNLLFHIANALLLFMVLLRMTGKLWRCAFIAAMFAFHPLNVESVAWAAERKNVLSTLFWLLTMWAYIRYAEKSTIKKYGLVLLFFALGLMSKPMLVTLPFVLLLLDYWPLGRLKLEQGGPDNEVPAKSRYHVKSEFLKLMLEKIPLFALTTGACILTFIAQQEGALINANKLSLSTRLTNAVVSYLEYLKKMIWPNDLAVFYPHPESTLAAWKWVVCFVVLVTITAISIKFIKKVPYFAVGWFWYLGTLIPVIGIVQVGGQAMADRYTYIPLIGIFIIVAWGVPELISKWNHKEKVLSVSVGIIILILLITTWGQVSHWKNSITIFKHALKVANENSYNSYLINYHLGNAFWNKRKTGEAISHYKMAIKINPDYAPTYNNLGIILGAEGKTEEEISHYKMAIKINPDVAEAHSNLANVLQKRGKNSEAISHYKMAIKIKPDYAPAYNNLGNALGKEGKFSEAISHYKMAIKITPDYAMAHSNLGNALQNGGKNSEAISHHKMAIKLNPDYAAAYNNLGTVLGAEGKTEEEISHYKMAIKLNPDYAEAHNNLGFALGAEGNNEEAISHFKMAIKLNPDYAEAHNNLGFALGVEGEEAISHYKMAVGLKPDLVDAHYNLGFALGAEGNNEEAISHYKMAIKFDPDHFWAHNKLGHALVQKGEIKEAVDHYRETVRLRPDLDAARDNLEFALFQLQKLE